MKLLFDPVYTNKSIARCATYYALHEMARHAVRRIPDTFAYIVAPSNTDHWDLDDLDPDPRIRYVKLPMDRDRYKELLFLRRAWLDKFAYWGEFYDWDVMVTTRVPSLMQTRIAVERSSKRKKVVAFEPFPIVEYKRTVGMFSTYNSPQLLTLGGYLTANLCAVNTEHEINGILGVAKKLLSPAKWIELKEKLSCKYILPVGVSPEFALNKKPSSEKEPRIVVYPQRLDKSERRPEMVMDTLKYAFVQDGLRGKVDIEFEVYTNSQSFGAYAKEFEFVRFQKPPREEFYRKLQQSDVFISFAVEEGLPLSLFEAICFGVIGVVKREPWSEDMFGPDYPWLVSGVKEAVAAVRMICDDYVTAYEQFRAWLKDDFVPRMEGRWDFLEWWEKYVREWDRDGIAGASANEIYEIVAEEVKDRDEFHLADTLIRLSEAGRTRQSYHLNIDHGEDKGRITLMFRDVNLYPIRKAFQANGWVDASTDVGHMRRVGE